MARLGGLTVDDESPRCRSPSIADDENLLCRRQRGRADAVDDNADRADLEPAVRRRRGGGRRAAVGSMPERVSEQMFQCG